METGNRASECGAYLCVLLGGDLDRALVCVCVVSVCISKSNDSDSVSTLG